MGLHRQGKRTRVAEPRPRNLDKEYALGVSGGCWLLVFIFSKIPELLDTLFLILKNRPIKLLQWYHHVSVMLFCWLALATEYAPGMWFAVMNFAVHSIMYLWFALFTQFKSLRPGLKKIGPFITFIQTSQMVVGLVVNAFAAFYRITSPGTCHIIDRTIYSAIVMYFSYFVLFAKLFYDSAIRSKKVLKEGCCNSSNGDGQSNSKKEN